MSIVEELFKMKDEQYKKFNAKIIPTLDEKKIIGVRIPLLREFAKTIMKTKEGKNFLKELPHKYLEEYLLHSIIISSHQDKRVVIEELDRFLPYVDNWQVCDNISPISFKTNRKYIIKKVYEWIDSKSIYTKRFGIKMLMTHFLDENFDKKYLKKVSEIETDEYYLKMMIAWFFTTALAKHWDETIGYIENKNLDIRIHNKVIQKSKESYRITDKQKQYLQKFIIQNTKKEVLNITQDDFIKVYWKQYRMMEREFVKTDDYVSIDKDNYDTFSAQYTKLLLTICSEIDSIVEALCSLHEDRIPKGIKNKLDALIEEYPNIKNYRVNMRYPYDIKNISPLVKFSDSISDWWQAYNMIKHNRLGSNEAGRFNYTKANLKNVLYALAALYILNRNLYDSLKKDKKMKNVAQNVQKIVTSEIFDDDIIL